MVPRRSPSWDSVAPGTLMLSLLALLAMPCHSDAQSGGPAYMVQPGDNLYRIAERQLGDGQLWPAIYRANPQIRDPERLEAGTYIKIPDGEEVKRHMGDWDGWSGGTWAWLEELEEVTPLILYGLGVVFLHVFAQSILFWIGGIIARVSKGSYGRSLRAALSTDLAILLVGLLVGAIALFMTRVSHQGSASMPTVDGMLDLGRQWLLRPSVPLWVLAVAPLVYAILAFAFVKSSFSANSGKAFMVTFIAVGIPILVVIVFSGHGVLRVT